MEKHFQKWLLAAFLLAIAGFLLVPRVNGLSDIRISIPSREPLQGWSVQAGKAQAQAMDLPVQIPLPPGQGLTLSRYLPHNLDFPLVLAFYTYQQKVELYIGDDLIYQRGHTTPSIHGQIPGNYWNFVYISPNYAGQKVILKVDSLYPPFNGHMGEILLAPQSTAILYIIQENLWRFLLSALMLMVGLGLLSMHYSVPRIHRHDRRLLYLALLSLNMGFFLLGKSHLLQLLTGNYYLITRLRLVCVMLLPILVPLQISESISLRSRQYFREIIAGGFILYFTFLLLDIFGLVDLLQLTPFLHLFLLFNILYTPYVLALEYAKFKNLEARHQLIAVSALSVSVVIETASHYHGYAGEVMEALNIGMPMFVFFMGRSAFFNYMQSVVLKKEYSFYKDLALLDPLTGGNNRRTYEQELLAIQGSTHRNLDIHVVMVDLNDLKLINDQFGHECGDLAIKETYLAMTYAFGGSHVCYRLGGDEFAAILTDTEEAKVEKCLRRFFVLMGDKAANFQFPFSAAAGSAHWQPHQGEGIYKAIKRADEAMYQCKLAQKQASGRPIR